MTYQVSFGTVSAGTLRTEDLLETFAEELATFQAYPDLIKQAHDADPESEEASELVNAMQDALNEFAPAYGYFGTHIGDGADFGFWPDWEAIDSDCFDGDFLIKVNDLSDVPEDWQESVLHVNDHGNCTLYASSDQGLTEVWAIV